MSADRDERRGVVGPLDLPERNRDSRRVVDQGAARLTGISGAPEVPTALVDGEVLGDGAARPPQRPDDPAQRGLNLGILRIDSHGARHRRRQTAGLRLTSLVSRRGRPAAPRRLPGMRIDTTDPVVRRAVGAVVDTVLAQGGSAHPELTVRHRGNHLWLELPRSANPFAANGLDRPDRTAPEILRVPTALNVPVTSLEWTAPDGRLHYTGDTGGHSAAQLTILDAMVDLFNACDKVRSVGQRYPRVLLQDDSELAAQVRAARPGFFADGPPNPASLVINSRLSRERGEGEEGPQGVFMPLIDMLNHHPYGSRYQRTDGCLVIRAHHPTVGDQVFVRYNKADAFGVALGLGYFEPATRFVASVAGEVAVPDWGAVRVVGVGQTRRHLPAPTIRRADDGSLRLAGVTLMPGRLGVLAQLLAMPLMSISGCSPAEGQRIAGQLISALVDHNSSYFRGLRELCQAAGARAGAP